MSVPDDLLLHFQEISLYGHLCPQIAPAASLQTQGILQRSLDLIKLQPVLFQTQHDRLLPAGAYKKLLQVLIGNRIFAHGSIGRQKPGLAFQDLSKGRVQEQAVCLPEILPRQLYKVVKASQRSLGGLDLRFLYQHKKRHPVFSDTGTEHHFAFYGISVL